MTGWAARRFWSEAQVERSGDGWTVRLDGRAVYTPGRSLLVMPTEAMARAVAAEWDAQGDRIDPLSMPTTRAANSAIEKVAPRRSAVVDALAAYGETDLICYRADEPDDLVRRQSAAWDPLLEWAEAAFGVRLAVVAGVMPKAQDRRDIDRLATEIGAMDSFVLTAFHDLVSLSGSLVLALAVVRGRLAPEDAWTLSRVDEEWQAERWGRDPEAEREAANRRDAFLAADRFIALAGGPGERA